MLAYIIQGVLLAAVAATVVRLYTSGLYRRYPIFFLYFIFKIPVNLFPFWVDPSSNTYLHIWVVTEPIAVILYILIVLELYRLVLEKYRGLYTVGKWGMYLIGAISLAISAATLIPRIKPTAPQNSKILGYYFAGERGIDFSLAIFLILLLFFLTLFPVKLSRNVRVHAVLYTIYFLSNTLALLLRGLFGMHLANQFNTLFSAISAGAVLAWLFLLTPAGEDYPAKAVHLGANYEDRALRQLDALNATLLRVSRN